MRYCSLSGPLIFLLRPISVLLEFLLLFLLIVAAQYLPEHRKVNLQELQSDLLVLGCDHTRDTVEIGHSVEDVRGLSTRSLNEEVDLMDNDR